MSKDSPDPQELGFYFSLSQVGLEMVFPVVVGVLLDNATGWAPWCVVVGAVLGLVTGLTHLVLLLDRRNRSKAEKKKQEPR
jgi:F0F1-type ATP synthase assembly protein I